MFFFFLYFLFFIFIILKLPLMRSMQQQHPFPASMHFPQNVRPRPPLNAQAMSLHQQSTIVQQQQAAAAAAAAMHKAQQAQHQGLPLQQHRVRPPQVGANNIASMRMPMNSNGMLNPEIKNLLQANQAAAANGGIGINMNNVKGINHLGLNIMQNPRLSMNGVNGQIPYPNIPAAQLQGIFIFKIKLIEI